MKTKTETSSVRSGTGVSIGLALQRARTLLLASAMAATMATAINANADRVHHDVAAGNVQVDCGKLSAGSFPSDANTELSVPVFVNGFGIINNHNISDHKIIIGDTEGDDVAGGVAIFAVSENLRNNRGSNLTHTVSMSVVNGGKSYEAATQSVPLNGAGSIEDNVNFAGAWFPYATWLGGAALNSTNANPGWVDKFVGNSALQLGVHFLTSLTNSAVSDAEGNGTYFLDLRSLGIDSRRDGVLLVNHAKNEGNYALSRVNNDDNEMDGTWTLNVHDNRDNGAGSENDPVSFVFVPKSNTDVVSGMIMGNGSIAIHSGPAPEFTVTWRTDLGNGQYELKIPGRSPDDGVLIISPAGLDSVNGDNIVTYQPNAARDGWIIQSRDLPNAGLQSVPEAEPLCSFVFIPAEKPGITAAPTQNLQTSETGQTAQFTVKLSGYPKPTADVTVSLSSSDTTEGTVSPSSITFTPADWNVPQTVTITGVDDASADGTQPFQINISNSTSADSKFNNLAVEPAYAINLDDEPGVAIGSGRVTTTEAGGSSSFTVWLTGTPNADVTVNISSSDLTEATVFPSSLTFTTTDFSTPQTVTVTGVDDQVQDGPVAYFVVTATATSTDPAYNGYDALDIQGENLDDDVAKVIIPADVQTVSEPGLTTSFPVVLGSQPIANVTINFAVTDATEASVTPSITFSTTDWNTPKSVTVTAVNDNLNDGPITSTLITTVTSTDPVYSAINPDDVTVITLDNETELVLSVADRLYGIGDPATGIDGSATVTDSDTLSYNGGTLTAAITTGGSSNDRLTVRNDGTAAGQIGLAGTTVSYGGTSIGTISSSGTGTTPLVVNLNAAATPEALQALLRAVTYQNVNLNAASQTKVLTLTLADGAGGTSTASMNLVISPVRSYSYQQGADGGFGLYSGAGDCQIDWERPNFVFPMGVGNTDTTLWIDYNPNDPLFIEQKQVLLRFTNIFGTGPGQIPPGAKIVDAKVYMNVSDSGHGARFNRMLLDWDADNTTWSGMGGIISPDDVEAVSGTNTFLGDQAHNTTTGGGYWYIGVTDDMQAWANGANNYGWVLTPWDGGDNGTAFRPCEYTNVALRPKLVVSWIPASVSSVSFRQGENGYTGEMDTQIRLTEPANTAFATATSLAPDWAVAATPLINPNQVLIRFDNIIGSATGQIPQGSTIYAAVLELASLSSASQGNGAQVNALLQPWTDTTSTWDSWVNGIDANGIEAAVTSTATLPAEGKGATVQSTRHVINLTADVQKFANGTLANNGWVLLPWPDGSNGWGFNSAEALPEATRPQLRVYFEPGVLMMAPVIDGTSMKISFSGVEGKTYAVQRTTNLQGTWSNVGTATVSGGTATYTDNAPPAGGAFYRVTW